MSKFIKIKPEELNINPFNLIGHDWMLITAEFNGKANTMTASWGGLGIMWNKNVAFIGIRPQRYTKEFVDNSETFSLTFFNNSYRDMLKYMGTKSGREEDKIKKENLSLLYNEGTPYFEESEIVMFCKKIYAQPTGADFFMDPAVNKQWYPNSDHHTLYIAEIIDILKKS